MLKQTMLSIKGALGFVNPPSKQIEKEGDSGNSSSSDSSEDGASVQKISYTTTGLLTPESQQMSDIKISTLNTREIARMIEEYKQTCKKVSYLGSIFDPKVVITKEDVSQKIPSKLSAKDVQKLAIQAKKIYISDLSSGNLHINLMKAEGQIGTQLHLDREEIKIESRPVVERDIETNDWGFISK